MLFGEKGRLIPLFAAVHALTGLLGSGRPGREVATAGNHEPGLSRAGIEPYPKAGRTAVRSETPVGRQKAVFVIR
jgi:hypothetical protein